MELLTDIKEQPSQATSDGEALGSIGRVHDDGAAVDTSIGRKGRAKKVTLHIVDEHIDFTRTPDNHLKMLASAIEATPEAAQQLQLQGAENLELPESLCAMVLRTANMAEKLIATMFLHIPPQIANHTMTVTAEDEADIVPPLKKVLQKHIPTDKLAYAPEAELALAVVKMGQRHYAATMMLLRAHVGSQVPPNGLDSTPPEEPQANIA